MQLGIKVTGLSIALTSALVIGSNTINVHADSTPIKQSHVLKVTDKRIKVYQVKKSNKRVLKTFTLSKNSVIKIGSKVKALNGQRITIQGNHVKPSQIYVTPAKQFTYSTKTMKLTDAQHQQVYATSEKWIKTLTKPQKKAIYNYTSVGYKDINSSLRGLMQPTTKVSREVGKIDRGLKTFNMPYNVTVWRGTSLQSIGYGVQGSVLKVGAHYSDGAYMSTSFNSDIARSFNADAIIKLQLPAGKFGAAIAPLSDFHSEDEFLVKHGEKLIITGITKSHNKTIVTMNLIA